MREPLTDEPERKRPPMPGAGRPPGALNKFTRELKTALLDAAILSDFAKDPSGDENAPHTLTNFCLTMVHKFPELYFQALMRLVPKEINTRLQNDTTLDITYRTMSEVKDAMLAEGVTPKLISDIEKMLPVPIHHEEEPAVDEEAHDDVELLDRGRA